MKKAIVTVACAVGLLLSSSSAQALTLSLGDAYYLGFVDPATPASPADMMFYVNYLANLDPGEVETGVITPNNHGHSYTFDRSNSSLDENSPSATLDGYMRTNSTTISDVSG